MPVCDAADRKSSVMQELHPVVYRMRHDIFISPLFAAERLGRMEKYVKVDFTDVPCCCLAVQTSQDTMQWAWAAAQCLKSLVRHGRDVARCFVHRDVMPDAIDRLVDGGFDLKKKSSAGNTLLHAAAMNDNFKLFVHLIAKFKLNPMQENNMKQTAWTLVPNKGAIKKACREGKILWPSSVDVGGSDSKLPPLNVDGRRRRNIIRPV